MNIMLRTLVLDMKKRVEFDTWTRTNTRNPSPSPCNTVYRRHWEAHRNYKEM